MKVEDIYAACERLGYTVWAYHRFALNLRDVEDLLAARGMKVSYETVCDRVARFGIQFAAKVRQSRPRPADKSHLDEVVVPIKGCTRWLWQAVDGEEDKKLIRGINFPTNGDVLDIQVQSDAPCRSFGRKRWGDEGYAQEELVAELGTAFLAADIGLSPEPFDEHAANIAHWLKGLRNDTRFIFQAAAHAQKVVDYLHRLQPNTDEVAT